jgi:hypothetical protein
MKHALTNLIIAGILSIPALTNAGQRSKEVTSWTLVDENPAISRSSAGMAYDSHRKVLVMFGGRTDRPLADTLEYDGSSWQLAQTANAPSPRYWQAMAYDEHRKLTVLFGGEIGPGASFGDTWEYDGTDWTQVISTTSPTPRSATSMVYDSSRKKMVLFSGYGAPNDTWEYDATDWTQANTQDAPPPRGLAGMAFDSKRGKTVLFGGCCLESGGDITWEYDGVNWQKAQPQRSPVYRWAQGMVYDNARSRIVLFGGCTPTIDSDLNDTWEYDGSRWSPIMLPNLPPPVQQHAMAYDAHGKRTIMFAWGQTWEYSTQKAGGGIK